LLRVLVCRFRKMAGDLVVDVAIDLPGTNEGPQPREKGPQACHDEFSEIFRTCHLLRAYSLQLLAVNWCRTAGAGQARFCLWSLYAFRGG